MGDESECQITHGCQIPLSFFRLLLDFGRDIFDFSSGFVDTVGIARQEFVSVWSSLSFAYRDDILFTLN